jgi:hypothetical protein
MAPLFTRSRNFGFSENGDAPVENPVPCFAVDTCATRN